MISYVIWKQNIIFERKLNNYFQKSRKIFGESSVQCKVGGQKEYREADGQVGIERSSR